MAAYYPENYGSFKKAIADETWAVLRWARRRKLVRRRREVERHSGLRQGRLLDVGCGTGLFLDEMARTGWRTVGLDPTLSAVRYARQRMRLEVHQGTLQDFSSKELFDVVTFWDALEHTPSPTEELNRANDLLRRGGTLALSVPNWNSLDRRLFGPNWQGLDPPRHLYVFSAATLTALLKKTGFSVAAVSNFMPGYFSFAMSVERWVGQRSPSLADSVGRILRLPGLRLLFVPWFTLLNGLDKGAITSVFARKVGS
jgi:SAM-dependent methyltransferase